MKKTLLSIIFIFIICNFYGQRFSGYIVTNTNDTIKCRFHNISNMFWKEIFNPATLRNNVKIINEKGEKVKYKPFELFSFVIKNVENTGGRKHINKDYKFVSLQSDDFQHFYEEVFLGEISCYRIYDQDLNANLLERYIYVKKNKLVKIGFLSERTDAGELIKDYSELYKQWMDKEPYKLSQMNTVFEIYNANQKKKLKSEY